MEEQLVPQSLRPFLRRLGEALTAVANGNPDAMKALCSHGDAVSQCGLWGGVDRGWAEVGDRWDWVAAQFAPGPGSVASDPVFLAVTGDMAYGVFLEQWRGQLAGQPKPAEFVIRATLIFRREDGEWKAVHRHGDDRVTKASPG